MALGQKGFGHSIGLGGFSDWVAPRRNAMLGLASGLLSSPDFSSGLSTGFARAADGRQADDAWATSQKAEAERMRQIEEADALKAKYADFFTQQGRTDIAQGIADGIVEPGAAYMDFIKPPETDPFTLGPGQVRYGPDGKPIAQGVQSLRANIASSSAGARRAAYDGPGGAYDAAIDYASEKGRKLEELLKRVDQSDLNAANALMRAEGHQSKQIIARIADDGTVTYQRMPDVRQIDYLTRALNDRSAANAGLGVLGGQTNAGRVYGNLAGDLRGAARDAVPEYGIALETAADPIGRSKAVEFGSMMFRPSTTRDEVANQVLRMSGPERKAAQQGLRGQIDEVLANVTRTVTDGDTTARESIAALKQLSSRANREKVTVLLGKEEADKLFARIDQATSAFELRANVANNSRTFQRQEMERRMQATTAPDGPISTLMRGEPLNAGKRGIQLMTGQTPEVALRQQDEIMSEVVQLLTARGMQADQVLQVLQSLGGRLNSAQSVADVMRILGERGALAGGVVSEQARQSMGR